MSEQVEETSEIEILESVAIPKRVKNTHQIISPVTLSSHTDTRTSAAAHVEHSSTSKRPSPSAENISQALKKQRLPTNKEMSAFRMFPKHLSDIALT